MKKRFSISISDEDQETLKEAGFGSLIVGVRAVCINYRKYNNAAKCSKMQQNAAPVVGNKKQIVKASLPKNTVEKESSQLKSIYTKSFREKYGTDPVWSVKEYTLANKLIKDVGIDNAKRLSAYYPTYIDTWHFKQRHPFSLLVLQSHKVLTDMQNIKHVVDARIHEKDFDEKVEQFDHESKMAELRRASELSRIAYKWALVDSPNLRDYQFEYEKFIESKGIDGNLPYNELKQILLDNLPQGYIDEQK